MSCIRLRNEIGVFWNGDVTACCYDVNGKLKVGSIRENNLKEIWKSVNLSGMRDLHIAGIWDELGLCGSCEATNYRMGVSLPVPNY
jgi:radical SAM protein with 4Fe4S-binding SPASM domain